MVFGNTYCAISHLEIKDGDACMLIPLGFRMNFEFDKYNKADINCFTYLHTFISEPIAVIFGGNISEVTYLNGDVYHNAGDEYEENELFMLVHLGFYNEILKDEGMWKIHHLDEIPLFNTVYPIYEKAKEILQLERLGKSFELGRGKITSEQYSKKISTPKWMIDIYKVALFMGNMGIAPHPIFCHDQNQRGKDYERMRKSALLSQKTAKKK